MPAREFCSPECIALAPKITVKTKNDDLPAGRRLHLLSLREICADNFLRGIVVTDVFKSDLTRRIAVLGAPIDIGASQHGPLMGPAALRTAGLLTLLGGLGFKVEDHGDLSISEVVELVDAPPDNARHYREIQRWTRALSAQAYGLARSGAKSRRSRNSRDLLLFFAAVYRSRPGSVAEPVRRRRSLPLGPSLH